VTARGLLAKNDVMQLTAEQKIVNFDNFVSFPNFQALKNLQSKNLIIISITLKLSDREII
jgi:hypothetical protein